ncbi:MAG: hypothetical protein IK048_03215 [Clostridia bacterium]|nr:hypothetical protein [Clostridia bacterium]
MKKLLKLLPIIALTCVFALALFACNKKPDEQQQRVEPKVIDEYNGGASVSWTDVNEDDNGLAYLIVNNERYDLGLNFLANAMVFNSQASGGLTEDEVFKKWYEWYNRRMDYMQGVVMAPHYYYLAYSNVEGVEDHPITRYMGFEQARFWVPTSGDALNLMMTARDPYWTSSSTYLDWRALIKGQGLLVNDSQGKISFNNDVVASHESIINAEGKRQVTVTIRNDLTFSDGTPIKAQNYLGKLLVLASPIYSNAEYEALAEKLDGYGTFSTATTQTAFKGVKMTDEYTMVFTYDEKYANYYWAEELLDLYPYPNVIFLGDNELVATEQGLALPNSAYVKDENERFVLRSIIDENNKDISFATSGAYRITKGRNDNGKGGIDLTANSNDEAVKNIHIESEVYPQQSQAFVHFGYDVGEFSSQESPIAVDCRPNNCMLQIKAIGPLASRAVRQALSKALNWQDIQDYYNVPNPANYSFRLNGYWAGEATSTSMNLDIAKANELLDADGWIYNADGTLYDKTAGGVRYKKVKNPTSKDLGYINASEVCEMIYVQDEDYYLMPLVIRIIQAPSSSLVTPAGSVCGTAVGMQVEIIQSLNYMELIYQVEGLADSDAGVFVFGSGTFGSVYDLNDCLMVFADEADSLLVY